MPRPDDSASAWHRRNPAPQRSRDDFVMPHPGAPARRVGFMSGSDDWLHQVACVVEMTISVVAIPTLPFSLMG